MNHQEIQKLIIPFVDDKLDKKDLEQFWTIWKSVQSAEKNTIFIIQ